MNNFIPTEGQKQALDVIRNMPKVFPEGGGVAVISGYAGTGKTTLLKVLQEETPEMFILTPTGKAAVRVTEASGCSAMTIHKWMYKHHKDEETGEPRFTTKSSTELELPVNGTLIIDEASMVGSSVFEHLYYFAKALALNMVFIGDGFQLPPVEFDPAKKAFSIFAPDFPAQIRVNLTEVLRQAMESPIIRISTDLRVAKDITSALLALDIVAEKNLNDAYLETLASDGAIICHKNATRHSVNGLVRNLKRLPSDVLTTREPLLVMRNNYQLNIFNGEVFSIENLMQNHGPVAVIDRYKNKSMYMNFQEVAFQENNVHGVISPEEVFGTAGDMDADAIGRGSKFTLKSFYKTQGTDIETPPHVHANLGYVLTAHKSQGSEWPTALVLIENSIRLGTVEGRRWTYTALTRAKNSVKVCWL